MTAAVQPETQARVIEALRKGTMLDDDTTRDATCECGRRFTQTRIAPAFVAMLERQAATWGEAFASQAPAGYLPVFCPPCERVDIARHADRAEARRLDAADEDRRQAERHVAEHAEFRVNGQRWAASA